MKALQCYFKHKANFIPRGWNAESVFYLHIMELIITDRANFKHNAYCSILFHGFSLEAQLLMYFFNEIILVRSWKDVRTFIYRCFSTITVHEPQKLNTSILFTEAAPTHPNFFVDELNGGKQKLCRGRKLAQKRSDILRDILLKCRRFFTGLTKRFALIDKCVSVNQGRSIKLLNRSSLHSLNRGEMQQFFRKPFCFIRLAAY